MGATRWAMAAVCTVALVVGAAACTGDRDAAQVSAEGAAPTTDARPTPGSPDPRNQTVPPGSTAPPGPADRSRGTTAVTDAAGGAEPAEAYVAALVELGRLEAADEDQRRCVAEHQVRAIGVDRLRAAGITPASIRDGSKELDDLRIDRPLAEALVDGYPACDYDLKPELVSGLAAFAHGDPGVRTCLEGIVTDELAREYAVLVVQSGAPEVEAQLEALLGDELGACFGPR